MFMPVFMFVMLADLVDLAAWKDNDLITGLLLAIFLVTLGIGLLCLFLVIHFLRTGRLVNRRNKGLHGPLNDRRLPHPGLGWLCRWLAIKSIHPLRVQEALQLTKPTPCSWAEAIAAAQEQRLFISPPIGGWVLVLGSALPDPAEDVDRCYMLLLELSRKLGHVQFFSLNRALNHHAWAQASHGQILRAYAWAGQTLWNQGRPTRAEVELRMKCFDYAEPLQQIRFADPNPVAQNTEKVPLLAARWSIDPAAIDPRVLRENRGITGKLSWRKTV